MIYIIRKEKNFNRKLQKITKDKIEYSIYY